MQQRMILETEFKREENQENTRSSKTWHGITEKAFTW